MKKIICFLSITFTVVSALAQSFDTGVKHYYYARYQSAENSFHEFLKQQPGNGGAWLWLVRSYLAQGETTNAADSLSLAPASLYDDPYYKIARGVMQLSKNNKDSASWYFEAAIDDTKGKNTDVLSNIAEMHIMQPNGDAAYALQLLEKALKRDKRNAYFFLLQGNAYRKSGNSSQAFQAYTRAIEEDKKLAEAHYQLGDIFVSQNNPGVYLEHFQHAIEADNNYAPAYYMLYRHYVNADPAKAMQYFKQYADRSEKTVQHDYAYTDLLYLTKDYSGAVTQANDLVRREGDNVQPRLYKLIAYSYQEMKDSVQATSYMQQYFSKEADSNFLVRDFEMMGSLYERQGGMTDSAIYYYQRALPVAKDSSTLYEIYEKLAKLAKSKNDYEKEAYWLEQYYNGNEKATNVNLFNWGLALYRSKKYRESDSVFGLYVNKYPDQGFGYYWRARSNAALDEEMKQGLAVPYYGKLIEMLNRDSLSLSSTDKKWLIEAYGYLAAYETNTEGDYAEAITYFDRLLEIDPENENAKKYMAILEESLDKEKGEGSDKEKKEEQAEGEGN
jgi:tetratricopeptide (TPR) repeat protein